jgi:hypothetical protein
MRRSPGVPSCWLAAGALLASCPALAADAGADGASISPYIDRLRQEMKAQPAEPGVPDPYIESLKRKMPDGGKEESSEGYTEKLKKDLGQSPSAGYTDDLKAKLGPSKEGGAIEALKEGKSELHARMEGEIHHAMGLRVGASPSNNVTSASGAQAFNTIYGNSFPVNMSVFYEYQPWHSEWFGNIGFFGEGGFSYYEGSGIYQFIPHNADGGGNFNAQSGTTFHFISIPLSVGLDYRFNLARLFRPFVMAGGTLAGFYEDRNDGGPIHTAISAGFYYAVGVNILLDWVSSRASWDLYSEHGIKHYYLTAGYDGVQTLTGDVHYTVNGFYGGFTFEF